MATSLPSKRILIADAPEIENFEAKFVYNFFTPDERINGSLNTLPAFIKTRPSETFDSNFLDSINFNRFIPRYIRFNWSPKLIGNNFRTKSSISIKDNIEKIYSESSFTVDEFTSVDFQDMKEEKLNFFIQRILNESRKRTPNETFESPLDIVKFIKSKTSKKIKDTLLTNSFVKFKQNGQYFINKDKKEISVDNIDKLNNVKTRGQLNKRFINKILKTVTENTINFYDDETRKVIEQTSQIQQAAISNKPSTIFDARDYDIELKEVVEIKPVDAKGFNSEVNVVGYIIRKTELTNNNQTIEHDPIIIESPFVGNAVDLNVRYGITYQYTIETVVLVTIQAEDVENNDILSISFLLSSKPSNVVTINCEEFVPPPIPADFNVQWDYIKGRPRLVWSFPVNTQRDIKYFQIFKRNSIHEPFQLIKMYDFDDSIIKSEFNETPDPNLVEIMASPKMFFIDEEFDKTSNAIYAICCLDAHGYSSNYTHQLHISFDQFANKIKKRMISRSGSPKAYPNLYLVNDIFIDSIKDSAHSKLKVYFNPEYLAVFDGNNNNLNLIKTKEDFNGKYLLQLINVDLQEQQTFEITISDKRTTEEKNQINNYQV